MDYRNVFTVLGRVLQVEGALMIIPLFISVFENNGCTVAFTVTAAILLILGSLLTLMKKDRVFSAKDGFIICGLSWIFMSAFGALPFFVSGWIPSYVDALFETASGFTTTGGSVIQNVEIMPRSLLFWRSFTHWIGGMGVLVFLLAILPMSQERTMNLMKAEVPGPTVGKLVSKARSTAMILYAIYIVLTVIEVLLLFFGGMPFFDAVVNSFATVGTGGFAVKNTSIAAYGNAYFDIVITVFMILSSINFNLYYLILLGDFRSIIKNGELRVFLSIIAVSTLIITLDIRSSCGSFGESLRLASFQVASIVSTTGFSTADFNQWSNLSQTILVLLMFIGGCAGSTGGGIKVARIILLIKNSIRELNRMLLPRRVMSVTVDGKIVDQMTLNGACSYFVLYVLFLALSVFILSFDRYDLTTNFTSVVSCLNNVGPALGSVGTLGDFSGFSILSKLVLTVDMWAGRLEIFPILMLFNLSAWKK